MVNDCLPCHFAFEEANILPHLPTTWQTWLRAEHASLRARGYPAAAVLAHSKREVPIFRRFAPAALVAQVEKEHAVFHPVLLDAAARHVPPTSLL